MVPKCALSCTAKGGLGFWDANDECPIPMKHSTLREISYVRWLFGSLSLFRAPKIITIFIFML